jgi:signal peptidase I
MQKILKSISDVTFILGLLLAGIFLLSRATGLKTFHLFIVTSGSMEPAIHTGSLVFVSPLNHYSIGDVVTFYSDLSQKSTTTHRIVAVSPGFIKTAGDANNRPDPLLVNTKNIIGMVRFNFPYLGYLAAFSKTPKGFILLVIVPATIIIYEELKSILSELKKIKETIVKKIKLFPSLESREGQGEFYTKKAFIFFPVIFAGFILFGFTGSYFSDHQTSSGNSLTAAWNPSISPTIIPTPTPVITNHVVISEVQIQGLTASQDFVELYNPTGSDVDLSSWKLRKRNSSATESSLMVIPAGKKIPAHGYFLWANSANNYASSINADISNTGSLTDNSSLAILDKNDTYIDEVAWGSGSNQFVETSPFPANPAGNHSLERKAFASSTATSMALGGSDEFKGNGFDSNNNSVDFVLRNLSQPQFSTGSAEIP